VVEKERTRGTCVVDALTKPLPTHVAIATPH
jgi:hypothetical protein